MFVRIAPYKHIIRFGKKGKLTSRFVRPFKVLKHIDKVAYQLNLLASMNRINNMFYVSLLHHVLKVKDVRLEDNLAYKECPVQILDK